MIQKLHLGKMTGKEMAAWFEISPSHYSKTDVRNECYEVLTRYAKFHLEVKGNGKVVFIDEIYEEEYKGKKGPPARQRVKELVQQNWDKNGLDSCAKVADKNYPILQAEGYTIAESTNYNYTCAGRTELWGSPMKRTNGEFGYCRYEYCKEDEKGQLIPFNEEEQKIKRQITEKYFGNLEDFTLGIVDDVKCGKITAEEAGLALANLGSHGEYLAWRSELETRLGCKVYKGTRKYEEKSAF